MSERDQNRVDFEAWHLKTRRHVNADSVVRKLLQEKDWETWQAARSNQPLVTELLEALQDLMYWDNGKPEWIAARAAIAKALGEQA